MKNISRIERATIPMTSITENIENKGYEYRYRILDQSIIEATRMVSEKLLIPIASKVFSYKKVRIVENYPKSIEQVYIDANKVPGLEKINLENKSLYKILEKEYGYEVIKNDEEIKIVKANKEEIGLLQLEENDAIMYITGTTYADNLSPLEYYEISSIPEFFIYRSVDKRE